MKYSSQPLRGERLEVFHCYAGPNKRACGALKLPLEKFGFFFLATKAQGDGCTNCCQEYIPKTGSETAQKQLKNSSQQLEIARNSSKQPKDSPKTAQRRS